MKEIIRFNFLLDPILNENIIWNFFREHSKNPNYERTFTPEELTFMNDAYTGVKNWEEVKKSPLYNEIAQSKYFTQMVDKAKNYLTTLPQNFDKYKDQINDYIGNKLKIDSEVPPKDVKVTCHGGMYCGGFITWGEEDKSASDPVFDAVYLVHEWLHALEHDLLGHWTNRSEAGVAISHAIIELAADEYLSNLLKGNPQNYKGHKFLTEIKDKIRPLFHEFVEGKGAVNFIAFVNEMIAKFE